MISAAAAAAEIPGQGHSGRVLVADDDRAVRESAAEILQRSGFTVTKASDGQEALEQLAAGEIDAVVLDVRMPRRDGLSVLEDMDPQPPPPGVVLVTAYDVGSEIRVRLGRRVTGILRKPVPPRMLIESVTEAVRVARGSGS